MDGIVKKGEGQAALASGFAPSEIVGALAENPRYAEGRCWIFGSSIPLDTEEPRLRTLLGEFFAGWASHGEPVSGHWQVVDERFLLIVPEPEGTTLSGCSMDSMQQAVRRIEQALGTQLLDSSRIFFRDPEGFVQGVSRSEFKALALAGDINEKTLVFDTTLTRLGAFAEEAFEKLLAESWHAVLYKNARRQLG